MGSTRFSGVGTLAGQEEPEAGVEKAATSLGDVSTREMSAEGRRGSRPPGAGAG